MSVSDAGKIVLHTDALQSVILRFSKLVCNLDLDTIWEQPDIHEPFFKKPRSTQEELNSQFKAFSCLPELKEHLEYIIEVLNACKYPNNEDHYTYALNKLRKFVEEKSVTADEDLLQQILQVGKHIH